MNLQRISELFETPQGKTIYNKVLTTIVANQLDKYIKNGILVGFSGGADSVFLLLFLLEYRKKTAYFHIYALHVNHGIRFEEAERDALFCESFCKDLGVDFSVSKIDCLKSSKEMSKGIEETARILRYSEFRKYLDSHKSLNCIAVAHNSTDNLETVIQRIMRGCGGVGLCGIPVVRDNIIRPLLDISSQEIRDFLTSNSVPFVFDSTNSDNKMTRNKIRNEILPLLRTMSNNPEESVSKMCRNLKEDNNALSYIADRFLENYQETTLPLTKLSELPEAVFSRVLNKFHLRYSEIWLEEYHIREIYNNVMKKTSFSISVPGNMLIVSNGKELLEKPSDFESKQFDRTIERGENSFPELSFAILCDCDPVDSLYKVYKSSISVSFSSAIISGKIRVRNRLPGDSWFYGGMTHKLKKLYNDKKIPENMRDLLPVFCDDKGILWVPGFGVRDDSVKNENPIKMTVFFTFEYPLAFGKKKG